MIPFCVKRASEFGLCVAYIVLHKRADRGNLGGGGGDDHSGRNNFRRCYALRLDPHFHHAA